MTTIHTEAFRRIEADETGFSVTCTSSDSTLEVALNADERRELADALVPGRDFSGVDWKTMFEHEIRNRVAAVALLRRERDEALRKKGEAFDRAVRAERELGELRSKVNAWGRERPAGAVSRADVAEALARCLDPEMWNVTFPAVVNEICDLFGVEAEQAVDPIEEKARELYRAATPDARWETVADEYRRIARHVLGQEASGDE